MKNATPSQLTMNVSPYLHALGPASAYNITSCTIELSIDTDDILYDPTPDTWSTHHLDGPTDNDAGRPTILRLARQ
jgi:hypothetical protein